MTVHPFPRAAKAPVSPNKRTGGRRLQINWTVVILAALATANATLAVIGIMAVLR